MAGSDLVHDPGFLQWIEGQRWFTNPGTPDLHPVGAWPMPGAGDVTALLVTDSAAGSEALYQVPVAVRPQDGREQVSDGVRDEHWVAALVALVLGGGEAVGTDGVAVRGVPVAWREDPPRVAGSRVLTGEQSNTSVIVDAVTATGEPVAVIVKVFRALHDGENPDVVLQSAIAAAGSDRVPATLGALVGTWPDPSAAGGVASGHLAVAQEFLAGTEDAWRVALSSARRGEDFAGPAGALGRATAEVHRVLADAFPTRAADDRARDALLTGMRSRAERAIRLVPALGDETGPITAAIETGTAGPWPDLQRVHGDYHLGQVLLVPDRGWVLLDFEGEPLRPMRERSEPDLALRDVAGMLRSFDYVAGTLVEEGGDPGLARAWADAARGAFLAGYEAELGTSLADYDALLTALELDKALYECEYEVRNRPDWLPIPEGAVRRLAGASA